MQFPKAEAARECPYSDTLQLQHNVLYRQMYDTVNLQEIFQSCSIEVNRNDMMFCSI